MSRLAERTNGNDKEFNAPFYEFLDHSNGDDITRDSTAWLMVRKYERTVNDNNYFNGIIMQVVI